ncbi:MAG: YdiU family protein [Bacteroidetes bacterium]|nr:YdiU family protein [Bacteroidota bacterium]
MSDWNLEHTYTTLPQQLFSRVESIKIDAPELVLYNRKLDTELGLNFSHQLEKTLAALFSGQQLAPDAQPIAQAYAGHQFGYFNILGDGRAILLGEHITPHQKRVDIQLKGAGTTPYSRRGDGLATLRSMLREYLISEAMHHLGIASTRSLAVVKTNMPVIREEVHEGAILTRIASSHIRVGTFEYAKRFLSDEEFKKFTLYVCKRHAPDLVEKENIGIALLEEVMSRQIALIVEWMRVGFIHGVMNTDNMSIAGETIDYGPCAFLNTYHPNTVFSSIDTQGRYAYGNQPAIAQWNLSCFAGTLLSLIDADQNIAIEKAKTIIHLFPTLYNEDWYSMMVRKIGLETADKNARQLVDGLLRWMKASEADYTLSFLRLMQIPLPQQQQAKYDDDAWKKWEAEWLLIIKANGGIDKALSIMKQANPVFIPRNHLVEAALDDAVYQNRYDSFNCLLERLQSPYQYSVGYEEHFDIPIAVDQGYQTFCGT